VIQITRRRLVIIEGLLHQELTRGFGMTAAHSHSMVRGLEVMS